MLDAGITEVGSTDIEEEASISAAENGRDEPYDEDYLNALRIAIDHEYRPEWKE